MRQRIHATLPLQVGAYNTSLRDQVDDQWCTQTPPKLPPNTGGLLLTAYLILTLGAWINATRPLPAFLTIPLLFAGASFLLYKVSQYPRWPLERPHLLPFLITALAMLCAAAWMNVATWVVAASDQRKHVYMPLQDNVRIGLHALQAYPVLDMVLRTPWADTMLFLVVLLAMLLSVLFDQLPNHAGFGMASRVLLTIALAFFIRPFFFTATVLPSAIPGCYAARFPAHVPEDVWSFIRVGLSKVRGSGGCNDLVFSGHVVLWTVVPLAWYHFVGGRAVVVVLWVACVHACCKVWGVGGESRMGMEGNMYAKTPQDVSTYQHYSIDFLVGVVVTWACWQLAGRWVYTAGHAVGSNVRQKPPPAVVGVVAGVLLLAVSGVALSGA